MGVRPVVSEPHQEVSAEVGLARAHGVSRRKLTVNITQILSTRAAPEQFELVSDAFNVWTALLL